MRAFAIYNPLVRERVACAWLLYEPGNDSFTIEFKAEVQADDLPLSLALLREHEGTFIPAYLARNWALSRIPPQERDNIADVLAGNRLSEYYIPALLVATQGRSSRDDFLLVEVDAEHYRDCNLNLVLEAPAAFGTLLSRARRAADLTQGELAERCGVQQAVISRIEAGKANPTLETMELLARGCGRDLKLTLE